MKIILLLALLGIQSYAAEPMHNETPISPENPGKGLLYVNEGGEWKEVAQSYKIDVHGYAKNPPGHVVSKEDVREVVTMLEGALLLSKMARTGAASLAAGNQQWLKEFNAGQDLIESRLNAVLAKWRKLEEEK